MSHTRQAGALVLFGAMACSGARGQQASFPRYLSTGEPLRVAEVRTPLCVAVDTIDSGGAWWWEPGRAGCSTRSTGPTVFRAFEAVVSKGAPAATVRVRFRLALHAPAGQESFADVALVLSGDSVRTLPSGASVPLRRLHQLDLPGPVSPDETRIAYASKRDGNWDIYVVLATGQAQARLTRTPTAERFPVWSRNGRRVAFGSERGKWELWVMNADGSDARMLTRDVVAKSPRSWSPDGSWVLFESIRDGNEEIYTVRVGDGRVVRLTEDPGADGSPSWSPDGSRIAFVSARNGRTDVYLMDADGSGQRALTNGASAVLSSSPAWSPDGTTIAFVSSRDGNREIYLIGTDGQGLKRLTTDPADDQGPIWSPDGTRIAFQSVRDGNYDLEVMDADGRNRIRLTDDAGYDGQHTWSADGRWLAFVSGREGSEALSVIRPDGTGTRRLTAHVSLDPQWSP